jgi:hypothetical protein
MNYAIPIETTDESHLYGGHEYPRDYPENDNDINYTKYNNVENDIYTNAFLWSLSMFTFAYCTISIVNACKGIRNNRRDTDFTGLTNRLTETSIETSIETPIQYTDIQYTDIQYTDNETIDTCSICLYGYKQDEKLVKLNCSHIYHKECIFDWFKKSRNCPICRFSV